MTILLPFSKRATSAVAVFACIGIASPQGAAALTNQNGSLVATPTQLGAIWLVYAQLVGIYQQLLHQDVANQKSVLNAIVAQAVTVVGTLNTTLDAMTATGDAKFLLVGMQEVTANALAALDNVTRAE